MNDKKNIYKIVAEMFRSITDHMEKKNLSRKWEYEYLANHWERLCRAKDEGEMVGWFNFGILPEPFVAFDIIPQQMENIMAPMAAWPEGKLTDSIDVSHQYVPDYLCFGHKTLVGAMVEGRLPKPDLIVGSTHPCDSSREGHSMIAGYYDVPYFAIDIPYWEDKASYEYVANQIRKLFSFLEEVTGRKLDIDKLREVVKHSNQSHEYILRTNELKKAVPCPLGGREGSIDTGMNTSLMGTIDAVKYFKKRYEQAKERVEKK